MNIAVIDLGTNSVRCDIFSLSSKNKLRRLGRIRHMIRMGDGVYSHGMIRGEVLKRTLRAFEHFSLELEKFHVIKTVAFGTSALRKAKNQSVVISEIFKKTGIKVKPISGRKEAHLIALGITSHEYLSGMPYLLVDIGGGSTELSICRKQKVISSHSLLLGANRLAQEFLENSTPRDFKNHLSHICAMRSMIRRKLGARYPQSASFNFPYILGSSGTIRCIKRIIKKQGEIANPLKLEHVRQCSELLSALNKKDYHFIPGIEPKRVDLILAGCVLFEEIMSHFGSKFAFHTERSLRDGIVISEILNTQ